MIESVDGFYNSGMDKRLFDDCKGRFGFDDPLFLTRSAVMYHCQYCSALTNNNAFASMSLGR
jgi:hypothetical protein